MTCHLQMNLEELILNIFIPEKKLVKANDFYSTNYKSKKFQACTGVLEKSIFDFRQKMYLEVVLPTSEYENDFFG
jgi:hypothetical protein